MRNVLLLASLLFSLSAIAGKLYTPQQAMKDIHSGKLVFLGRDMFPGNDQNRTCVYRSDKAYILYNNCMSSKKESSATDIEVYSFEGGIIMFYIQNKVSGILDVSKMTRAQYDMSWKVYAVPAPAIGPKMTMAQLKKFKETNTDGGCGIGNTFNAADLTLRVQCFRGHENPEWIELGGSFWLEPGEEWMRTKQYLRQTVIDTKF